MKRNSVCVHVLHLLTRLLAPNRRSVSECDLISSAALGALDPPPPLPPPLLPSLLPYNPYIHLGGPRASLKGISLVSAKASATAASITGPLPHPTLPSLPMAPKAPRWAQNEWKGWWVPSSARKWASGRVCRFLAGQSANRKSWEAKKTAGWATKSSEKPLSGHLVLLK